VNLTDHLLEIYTFEELDALLSLDGSGAAGHVPTLNEAINTIMDPLNSDVQRRAALQRYIIQRVLSRIRVAYRT